MEMVNLSRPKQKSYPWVAGIAAFGLLLTCLALASLPWWLDQMGTFRQAASPADLDLDGDLDVVLHHARYESAFTFFSGTTFWINEGQERYKPSGAEFNGTESGGTDIAVGDVDLDGDPDLLMVQWNHVRLVVNQGSAQAGQPGSFRLNNTIKPAGALGIPGSIVLGDLNGDGQVDGFVAGCCETMRLGPSGNKNSTPPRSWVWINDWNQAGWLDRHSLNLSFLDGVRVRDAALGDLDGDGDLDVFCAVNEPAAGEPGSGADLVLMNDGSGLMSDTGQRLGSGNSFSVALGDLDGDTDLDALVGSGSGAVLWINQGGVQIGRAGEFAASDSPETGSQTEQVFLADFDSDGDLDGLLASQRVAEVWWNDGQAGFSRSNQRFFYTKRHGLAVADLNGDSFPDIFAAASSTDHRVWLNNGSGDFDRK